MRTFLIGAVALVWVATLLVLSVWIWLRSRRAGLDTKAAQARRRAERDRRRPERDLERVVRQAAASGAVVAVARRGSNPTRVTWSDGSIWFYFVDDASVAAHERGALPPGMIHVGEAPALGSARPSTTPPPPGARPDDGSPPTMS